MINSYGNQLEIIITPVANGWVVQLPPKREDPNDILGKQMAMGAKMVKDLSKDPMLAAIETEANAQQPQDEEQPIEKDARTFVFPKFGDVLNFLRYKIED
jgi:hypothetical protein